MSKQCVRRERQEQTKKLPSSLQTVIKGLEQRLQLVLVRLLTIDTELASKRVHRLT